MNYLRVAITVALSACVLVFFQRWYLTDFDTSWISEPFFNWPWWAMLIVISPVITGVVSSVAMWVTRESPSPSLEK
jgi:hypothetical protein